MILFELTYLKKAIENEHSHFRQPFSYSSSAKINGQEIYRAISPIADIDRFHTV